MTWYQISFIPTQYANPATGLPYNGAILAAYAAGTTTPILMATDTTGATTASYFQIGSQGFPLSSGGAVVIPTVSQNYKLVLYPTLAAYNAQSGAIWTVDNINIAAATNVSFVQEFSGDASTTTFNLSQNVGTDPKALMVFADAQFDSYVTDGTFNSSSDWTLGAGWTIAANTATATGAISTAMSQTSPIPFIQGELYTITYTMTQSAGSIIASVGGTNGTSRNSAGTYTETVLAGSSQTLAFTGSGFTGTITNVSVHRVLEERRQVCRPEEFTLPNGNQIQFVTAPAKGTNNIIVFAPSLLLGAAAASAAAAATSATNSAASAVLASQWASQTTGIVAATDYSAKAWAIGGTGVTTSSGAGAAKEWATTTGGKVDTAEYGAKEYAIGTTVAAGSSKSWATLTSSSVDGVTYSAKEFAQGSQAGTGGSAANWAQQSGADVTGAAAHSRSAKSWAQDNNTGATLGGSSKDWAQTTGGTVDGTNYAAKEWAVGTTTTSGSAKDWAVKTTAQVQSIDSSAKAWAIGGTGLTDGAAKNWAQQTGADVTGATANSRSAKSWAQDNNTGATLGGSAKDWAQTTGGTVDGTNYAAKEWAIGTTTTSGSAKDWAVKTSAQVQSVDSSAKAWAIGGTGLTDGAAKNWAQQTGADVTGATALSRSAKSWAQDDLHGATYGGSAKDWAQSASSPDGTNQSAKTYATQAQGYASALTDTSTTSLAISAGAATFTVSASKAFATGQFFSAVSNANAANYMHGTVTSYGGTSLVTNVTDIGGSGTHADWNISISGSQGATGSQGAAGSVPISAAGGTVDAITGTPSGVTLADLTLCAIVSAGANTLTNPTFAPNSLTAHTITARGGGALVAGDTGAAGYVMLLEYNLANTRWELLNPAKVTAAQVLTLNQNTSGSAASLSISGQTGLLTFTGLASTNRAKIVRDAADTILELGGSYTPTGTWTSMTLVTPALGTPASGVLTNCTSLPAASVNSGALVNGMTATTQSATDNSTKLATTAYVDQVGGYVNFTGTTQAIGATDRGKTYNFTGSSACTVTLANNTGITGGGSYWMILCNNGTANITLQATTSTIDGLSGASGYIMYPGEKRLIEGDATNYKTQVLKGFTAKFTSSGSFTVPPGYTSFLAELISGGGAGGARSTTGNSSGGSSGGYFPFAVRADQLVAAGSTETVTVGGTAAGVSGNTNGTAGNNTTFTVNGTNVTVNGGGGGLQVATSNAANCPSTGYPTSFPSAMGTNGFYEGISGNLSTAGTGLNLIYAGGGGDVTSGNVCNTGGSSIQGPGGGGSSSGTSGGTRTGGTSVLAGAGGTGGSTTGTGVTSGSVPGGGGGATVNGTTSGAGAAGQITIRGIV